MGSSKKVIPLVPSSLLHRLQDSASPQLTLLQPSPEAPPWLCN